MTQIISETKWERNAVLQFGKILYKEAHGHELPFPPTKTFIIARSDFIVPHYPRHP